MPDKHTLIVGNGPQSVAVALHVDGAEMVGPGMPYSGWKRISSGQRMTHFRSPHQHFVGDPKRPNLTPGQFWGAELGFGTTDDGRMRLEEVL